MKTLIYSFVWALIGLSSFAYGENTFCGRFRFAGGTTYVEDGKYNPILNLAKFSSIIEVPAQDSCVCVRGDTDITDRGRLAFTSVSMISPRKASACNDSGLLE